jgi:hypothetical protein
MSALRVEASADYRMTAASINAQIQGARISRCEAYFKVHRSACGMKRNTEIWRSAKPLTRGEKDD